MTDQLSLIDESERGMAVAEAPPSEVSHDLRHAMMTLPVEAQNRMLSEYKDRRDNFRSWLKSQLVEGVHYGFPPGCEPESRVVKGVVEYAVWGGGGKKWYPESQWKPKPPLYAAGADFICDLLGARPEYKADLDAWHQLGSKAGYFVIACYLKSRATDELLGEGRGVRQEGQKRGDANNAIKMAEKSAKVDATINTWGLRDLFGQEEEVVPNPPHDNPDGDTGAPRADTRATRNGNVYQVTADTVKYIGGNWRGFNSTGDEAEDRRLFCEWVTKTTGREKYPSRAVDWTKEDVAKCCEALSIPAPWEEM